MASLVALRFLLSSNIRYDCNCQATAHNSDKLRRSHIGRKLAYILCGGNLSAKTFVSEQYLLDLEREAFLSLLGEKKTQDRMKFMLEKGKPLQN